MEKEKEKNWKIEISNEKTSLFRRIEKEKALDLIPVVVRGSIDKDSLIYQMDESNKHLISNRDLIKEKEIIEDIDQERKGYFCCRCKSDDLDLKDAEEKDPYQFRLLFECQNCGMEFIIDKEREEFKMKIRKEKKNEWFELCAIPEKWKEFTDGHMAIPDKCSDCPTYVKENCDRGEMRAEMISEERIYSMAISHWGEDPQLNQLMEELAECIIASNKIRRNANGIDEDEMAEELIDADIMINQAKHLLPIDIEKFREIKIKKLKRLLDKIQVERETEAENHNLMMNDAMEEDKDGE